MEAHRQNRGLPRIVEHAVRDPQPLALAISAGVVERVAGAVDPVAGSLPRDQDPRSRMDLDDRSRAERHMLLANRASTYFGQQRREGSHS